ncbi:MAG: hypothetical protein A3J75_00925 [Acidobacteria bacterium RBG_16_68_9]|nr:MAG: hypothetical protein A3J75_00925 [Acidobacteria bacterium RBG_16_68_9]
MTESRLIRRTLTDFFRDLLQGAMRTHQVESSEDSEFYLVKLLERFAHPTPDWNSRPLALEYLESFHSPTVHRCAKLRHVGDTSLFLSGIFMENLERRIVPTSYYISLGRLAYHQLAALAGGGTSPRGTLFAEMAERFVDFVHVLTEISFEQLFPGDARAIRVYTRWLRTRSQRDAAWLLRHGLIPVDPGSGSRH